MKRAVILFSCIILLAVSAAAPARAEVDYDAAYEGALKQAGNDLFNIASLNEAVALLAQTGTYKLSTSYRLYFQQLIAVQSEYADLDSALVVFDTCGGLEAFTDDLRQRGFPSCADLSAYVNARIMERSGDLEGACAVYKTMAVLDSLDRAVGLAGVVARLTPAPAVTEPPMATPRPTDTPRLTDTPRPTATPKPSVNVQAGDFIRFGHYEQDNKRKNGAEAIEWQVLDVRYGMALLVSRYGLDTKPYNRENAKVTWETCSLRRWLNTTFLNDAFSRDEQAAIAITNVSNSSAQGYSKWDTWGGNDTDDRLFLLSYAEADYYFSLDSADARVAPTNYAVAQGARTDNGTKTYDGWASGWWWLRSPGYTQGRAASIGNEGSLHYYTVYSTNIVVRPALWLDLSSVTFISY